MHVFYYVILLYVLGWIVKMVGHLNHLSAPGSLNVKFYY